MNLTRLLTALSITLITPLVSILSIATPSHASRTSLLIAQSSIGCRSNESTFVETETENYWIFICGGDAPATYLGVEKGNPSNSIRLPLSDYDPQGDYFEAINNDVLYILAKTPRGIFLTVTQGNTELLREPVLYTW